MNSKVWFEDVKETINTLKNEVTPNLLYKIVQRRITEIPNRIFDRGKEMLQSEYIDSPTLRVTMYEDDQEKHPTYLPTETDRWMKKHGQSFGQSWPASCSEWRAMTRGTMSTKCARR